MSSVSSDQPPAKGKDSVVRRAANTAAMIAFRTLLYACAVIPQPVIRFFSSCAGWLAWHLNTRSRKITEVNIAIAFPDLTDAERRDLARASFKELYLSVASIAPGWMWSAERAMSCISSIVGEEYLQAAVAEGRGVIVLLPHLGSWELLGPYLNTRYTLTTLYKEPKNPALNDVILQSRQRHGNTLVPANKSGVRALLKALKSREVIVVLPDQIPTFEGGEFAPFFGEPALTMTLVSKLLNRNKSKAVMGFTLREPDNSFKMVFRPVDDRIYSDDGFEALCGLNKSVEDCVLECPEQYQWEYKRYKFLPDYTRRSTY